MAVRSSTYGRQMDKSPAGKSAMAQHKRAVHMSSTMTKEDKYDKPSLTDRVMLGMMKMGKGKPKTNKETARLQRSKKGK